MFGKLAFQTSATDPTLIVVSATNPLPTTTSGGGGTSNVNLIQVNGTTAVTGGVAGSQGVGGLGASGAALAGNPNLIGAVALSAEPAATTTGFLTVPFLDLTGKQVTSPYANRENMVRGAGSSTTTGAITLMAAGGASIKNYCTSIQLGNTSATTIFVTLNDSATTILVVPAGGGSNITFNVPLVTAANTALTATPSAGAATIYGAAQGFKGY